MAYFHVYLFVKFDPKGSRGRGHLFRNLTGSELRDRVVARWDRGQKMTWDGQTVDSLAANIRVIETENPVDEGADFTAIKQAGFEVTNEVISGPAGDRGGSPEGEPAPPPAESRLRDPSRVMVVHGRNAAARDAMFTFLRALGLAPVEWEEAVQETGMGSPHNLDAARAAMEASQAVVVVLTAEDRAGLLPELVGGGDDQLLRGQPRQNVMLEAGLAMGIDQARTILVQLGDLRAASDLDGLNAVRLTNDGPKRQALRSRLRNAGCAVGETGSDWMSPDAGGDFERAVIPWSPTSQSGDNPSG